MEHFGLPNPNYTHFGALWRTCGDSGGPRERPRVCQGGLTHFGQGGGRSKLRVFGDHGEDNRRGRGDTNDTTRLVTPEGSADIILFEKG